MRFTMKHTLLAAGLVLAAPVLAQDAGQVPEGAAERTQAAQEAVDARELRDREVRRERSQMVKLRDDMERARERNEAQEVEVQIRMEEAERKLAEAARQIAELSQRNLPQLSASQMQLLTSDKTPRLGITISGNDDSVAVEGVTIAGVTPGGAAAEAGLEAGDVITSINGESMAGRNSQLAGETLVDFMRGVELGDKLKIEYLRDDEPGSVELEPRTIERNVFAWRAPDGQATYEFFTDGPDIDVRVAPGAPGAPRAPGGQNSFAFSFGFPFAGRAWSSLEIIELNEGLGRYFGTDSGLLVVSAPESSELKLQDGDVIKSIDGREPESVGHAMRILSSYEPGESLDLNILRDKKKRTLKIQMPDDRRGYAVPPVSPVPPLAPASAPLIVVPDEAPNPVVIIESDT